MDIHHRRDLSQPELYQQREEQGEATSADTPDGEKGIRGHRESSALPHLSLRPFMYQCITPLSRNNTARSSKPPI